MSRHRPRKAEVEARKRAKRDKRLRKRGRLPLGESRLKAQGGGTDNPRLMTVGTSSWWPRLGQQHITDLKSGKMADLTPSHLCQTDHTRSRPGEGVIVFAVVPKKGGAGKHLGTFKVDLNAKTIQKVSD